MMEKVFVFDLDNTLYPKDVGLWRVIDSRIEEYVKRVLGTDIETARSVRKGFLRVYGTTLRGLVFNHGVDPEDYLSYVHDVPVEEMLSRDEELRMILDSIPGERYVFTNASRDYAERVLKALGIEDCFSEVFDIFFMDHMAKPGIYPFRKLLAWLSREPAEVVFLDDHPDNVRTATDMGFITVLVGSASGDGCARYAIPSVKKLPDLLDFLLRGGRVCGNNPKKFHAG